MVVVIVCGGIYIYIYIYIYIATCTVYISVTRSHTTESRYENNIGAACGSP